MQLTAKLHRARERCNTESYAKDFKLCVAMYVMPFSMNAIHGISYNRYNLILFRNERNTAK